MIEELKQIRETLYNLYKSHNNISLGFVVNDIDNLLYKQEEPPKVGQTGYFYSCDKQGYIPRVEYGELVDIKEGLNFPYWSNYSAYQYFSQLPPDLNKLYNNEPKTNSSIAN